MIVVPAVPRAHCDAEFFITLIHVGNSKDEAVPIRPSVPYPRTTIFAWCEAEDIEGMLFGKRTVATTRMLR
jgi:hypothetical protein